VNRLRNFLILMRARLWLVPGGMSFAGLALGYFMLTTGMTWTPSQGAFWIYGGDAESARNLLSALLSGIISMTSLVISLTFVSLTLAANQLGPRLIVSFIADRQIQAVLGLFLATVLYMIFVMRTLGDELGSGGVPHLAITVASALAMSCMFALLFYVHKVSRAIIADTVIERVGEELQDAIEETLPGAGEPPPQPPAERLLPAVRRSVSLDASGYVQTIDYAAARRWACANDLLVQFHVQPGEYVLRRGAHLSLRSDREPPDDLPLQALRDTIVLGTERSPAQDLGYFIRQIVEVAVRALSPGVNDPFTAYAAINQLASAVESILERPDRPRSARDEDGALRLVMAPRGGLRGHVLRRDPSLRGRQRVGARLSGGHLREARGRRLAPASMQDRGDAARQDRRAGAVGRGERKRSRGVARAGASRPRRLPHRAGRRRPRLSRLSAPPGPSPAPRARAGPGCRRRRRRCRASSRRASAPCSPAAPRGSPHPPGRCGRSGRR
jgi:uncharacterized membrane protein